MGRRGAVFIVTASLLAGCGGGTLKSDGGPGAAGAAGPGSGGSSGGAGGSGGAGVGTCAIRTRPADPMDPFTTTGCNMVAFGADWVSPDALYPGDAGVVLPDGGSLEQPVGGTIVDGDYDLVRFRSGNFGMRRTHRSIRIFDHATFIEWLVDNDSITPDGGVMSVRFNTSAQVSGTDLAMVMVTCGGNDFSNRFGYTASGGDLLIYQYNNSVGELQNVFTYRRTCTR